MDQFYSAVAEILVDVQDKVGREVTLTEPFFGLGGVVETLGRAGIAVKLVNCFELDEKVGQFHKALCLNGKRKATGYVMSGRQCGDMMNIPLEHLADSDLLACGPPCQGFCPGGMQRGDEDSRSDCYRRILEWVVELATRGALKAYFIENAPGIMDSKQGRVSFAEQVIPMMCQRLPHFQHGFVEANPESVFPVRRRRLWLRGVRAGFLKDGGIVMPIPKPLLDFGIPPVPLEILLDRSLQHTPIESLPRGCRLNLTKYLHMVDMARAWGEHGRMAVFELDRDPSTCCEYKGKLTYDLVPPMRCKGPPYFVASVWDMDKPVCERAFHRLISVAERFLLAGYPKDFAEHLPNQTAILKATGNAYPVPMVVQVVLPVVKLLCSVGAFLNEDTRRISHDELEKVQADCQVEQAGQVLRPPCTRSSFACTSGTPSQTKRRRR